MKTIRAITIGVAIWAIGVVSYSLSFFFLIMKNPEQQANTVLFLVVMPLVWLGSALYYKNGSTTHGYKVGLTFLLVAAALDALITVPLFMVPQGVGHLEFFTSIGFWVIALEFILVALLYWVINVRPKAISTQKV